MIALPLLSKGLLAGIAACLVVIACQAKVIAERGEALADLRADHAELVAAAEKERAAASERYREIERQRDAELDVLRTLIGDREHARQKAAADARVAGDRLRIALDTVAATARAAPTDAGAAARTYAACAATVDVLREANEAAGDLAEEAGRLAAMTLGLQEYARNVCLRTSPPNSP